MAKKREMLCLDHFPFNLYFLSIAGNRIDATAAANVQ